MIDRGTNFVMNKKLKFMFDYLLTNYSKTRFMKRNFLFLMFILATVSTVFVSCSKDENTDPQLPTISFVGGSGYISADATYPVNTALKVGINAASNATSGAKLTKLVITRTFNNVPTVVLDSTISVANFNTEGTFNASPVAGTERWSFKVTDADNQSNEISFNIITTPTEATVNIYTAILMGGQGNNTIGSFWSSSNNTVYKQADATNNQNKVDFLYFYGTTNLATIAATDDDQANIAWNNIFNGWTTKNATRFKKVTGVNWEAITANSDDLINSNATDLTLSRSNNLAVGDIIAFETASTSANANKKGLFKVISITGTSGADRAITIEVKIKK